jgi:hypothetical protein
MRPHRSIVRWSGETHKLGPSLTLIRCGGHFPGATVLHWRDSPGGMGALLTGDVLQVVPDRRHVSFMRSYPNFIPLNAPTVRRIAAAVEPCEYDRIYGAWWGYNILGGARPAVAASIARYLRAIEA